MKNEQNEEFLSAVQEETEITLKILMDALNKRAIELGCGQDIEKLEVHYSSVMTCFSNIIINILLKTTEDAKSCRKAADLYVEHFKKALSFALVESYRENKGSLIN